MIQQTQKKIKISEFEFETQQSNILATRSGTAATRPSVNTVGNVRTLEDDCDGGGEELSSPSS